MDGIAGARAWVGAKGDGEKRGRRRGVEGGKERKAGAFSHFTPPFREIARTRPRTGSLCFSWNLRLGTLHCSYFQKEAYKDSEISNGSSIALFGFFAAKTSSVLKGCVNKHLKRRYLFFIVLSIFYQKQCSG